MDTYVSRLHKPPVRPEEYSGRGHGSQGSFLPIGLSDQLAEFDRLLAPPSPSPPPNRTPKPRRRRRRPVPPVTAREQRERAMHKRLAHREFVAAIGESNSNTRVCEMGRLTARDLEADQKPLSWLPSIAPLSPPGPEPVLLPRESLRPAVNQLLAQPQSKKRVAVGPDRAHQKSSAQSVKASSLQLSKLIGQIDREMAQPELLSVPQTARPAATIRTLAPVAPQAPNTARGPRTARAKAKAVSQKAAQAGLNGEWLTEQDCSIVLCHARGQQRRLHRAIRGCEKRQLAAEKHAVQAVEEVLRVKVHRHELMRSCIAGGLEPQHEESIGAATEAHRKFHRQYQRADAKLQLSRQQRSLAYSSVHKVFSSLLSPRKRAAALRRVGGSMEGLVPHKRDASAEQFFSAYHSAVGSQDLLSAEDEFRVVLRILASLAPPLAVSPAVHDLLEVALCCLKVPLLEFVGWCSKQGIEPSFRVKQRLHEAEQQHRVEACKKDGKKSRKNKEPSSPEAPAVLPLEEPQQVMTESSLDVRCTVFDV